MNIKCRICKKESNNRKEFLSHWKNNYFKKICKECYKNMKKPFYIKSIQKRYGNKLEKYKNIDEKIKCYTAGIIDGEGCIFIAKGKPRGKRRTTQYGLVVSVGMASPIIINFLKKTFDGNNIMIRPNKNKRFKTMYLWKIQAIKAEGFLKCILPYLKLKHKEAELGLEFRKHMNNYIECNGRSLTDINEIAIRETYKLKLQELKKCL